MDTTKINTTKHRLCSVCGESGHNKRNCPNIPIEDIDIIEEKIIINPKKELLMQDLKERQAYDIPTDIFTLWILHRNLCKQSEIRYILDDGLNKDSIKLYLNLLDAIDEIY
jgi:hypothetical protein